MITINTTSNILYLNSDRYDICLGKETTKTPKGIFEIAEKFEFPWLRKKDGTKIEGGMNNPLGSRLIILSDGKQKIKEGIHGCNPDFKNPGNITNGCIRMHNKDIEELFEKVSIGDLIKII